MTLERVSCPGCGATYDAAVEWCTQCYEPLQAVRPRPLKGRPQIVASGDVAAWQCKVCETLSPLAASSCVACGWSIYDAFEAPVDVKGTRDPQEALVASAWFPGAGLIKAGVVGMGALVATLAALDIVVGILFLTMRSAAQAGGAGAGGFLLVIAVALWGVSAFDAIQVADGRTSSMVLRPRLVSMFAGLSGAAIAFFLFQVATRV